MADLPERSDGRIGESTGETLMRALDNMRLLEDGAHAGGGKVSRLVIAYEVEHEPTGDHPHGAHTTGYECTPGMSAGDIIGLLTVVADEVRFGDG